MTSRKESPIRRMSTLVNVLSCAQHHHQTFTDFVLIKFSLSSVSSGVLLPLLSIARCLEDMRASNVCEYHVKATK